MGLPPGSKHSRFPGSKNLKELKVLVVANFPLFRLRSFERLVPLDLVINAENGLAAEFGFWEWLMRVHRWEAFAVLAVLGLNCC